MRPGAPALSVSLLCNPVRVSSPTQIPVCPTGKWRQRHCLAAWSTRVSNSQQLSTCGVSALLLPFQDLDDMDAHLLGLKKSNLASSKRAAKDSGKEELPSNPKPANMLIADEKGEWEIAPRILGHSGDVEDALVLWVFSAWIRG